MRLLFLSFLVCFHLLWNKGYGQNALKTKYREWLEDDERIEVSSWYAETEIEFEKDWSFEFLGTVDAWSGATPNGLPPEESDPGKPNEWLNVVPEEIRKAGLFTIRKEVPEYNFSFEYGISDEPDYLSRSYALQYSYKLAAETLLLNAGISFQDDSVQNADGAFVEKTTPTITFGLNRILDKFTSFTLNLSYSWPSGYLSDPYKGVPANERFASVPDEVFLFKENRPDQREIFVLYSEISRYFESLALGGHMSYRYFQDDFELDGHTLEIESNKRLGDSLVWSPRYRYYRQSKASFYSPLARKYESYLDSPNPSLGPFYSADHRLSSLESHSYGLKISYFLRDNLIADLGFDRYLTSGKDVFTDPRVYPDANVFTLGLQWEY